MNAIQSSLARAAGLVAGTLLAISVLHAEDPKPTNDTFAAFENYIKFSGQGVSLTGSKAAYQKNTQTPQTGALGIEDFSFTKELNSTTTAKMDGRALAGAEDYLAQFQITKTDVGSFEVGYKQFRTFYDGAGGFFPINNAWLSLYPRSLAVDRGKFYATAVIATPDMPVFTFKYTNETRTGKKDSTIWGDTDQTGIPIYNVSSLNPISANRKIVPAYLNLDERHQEFEATVSHKIGRTSGSLSIIGTSIDNNDRRSVDRYPGELRPYPALPTTQPAFIVTPVLAQNQNKGFDLQRNKENAVTVNARIETEISDKVRVYFHGSRRNASSDIAAERMITASTATKLDTQVTVGAFTSGGRPPYSYYSVGSIDQSVWTGVIGLETKLAPDLKVNAALRYEDYRVSGYNNTTYVSYLITPATGTVEYKPVNAPNGISLVEKPVSPEIQIRYSAIKNLPIYLDWDYRSSPSTESVAYNSITPAGLNQALSSSTGNNNIKEKHSNLKLGANWNACSFFTARAEIFTKDHENTFTGFGDNLGDLYVLNYDIYGARLTGTIKPQAGLTLTTRFIEQLGKATTMGDSYVEGDSGDSKRYQLSETVDWAPNKSVYVQANLNVVFDTIKTSYPVVTGLAQNVLHNADNNYYNGSVLTGFAVEKNTDLLLQGTYYKADNYQPALAGSTVPYGMSAREYSLTVGVKHKMTERAIVNAKVGYLDSTNATAGGFSDYHGPLAYVSVDYKL